MLINYAIRIDTIRIIMPPRGYNDRFAERFVMIIRFPTAAATNNDEADHTRSHADGRARKWLARLANEPGPPRLAYLNGWIAGTEARPP